MIDAIKVRKECCQHERRVAKAHEGEDEMGRRQVASVWVAASC